jgi:hypothetical protein
MHKIILILFLSFLESFQVSGQIKWPYCEFEYAKAYLYNLETQENGNYQIVREGKISVTATSDGVLLSKEQSKEVLSLINSDVNGLISGLSKTIIPHHAIVLFSKRDKPLASLMICFDGEGIILNPEKKAKQSTAELSVEEVKIQGDKLLTLKSMFQNLGFPVLNSPLEYRQLKMQIQTEILELADFKPIRQLNSEDNLQFDLSGMLLFENKVLAIADKDWNNHIYKIDTTGNSFLLSIFQELCTTGNIDIEGIEYYNNRFYLINEFGSDVYFAEKGKCTLSKLEIPWKTRNIDNSVWGNKGLEGIAIDGENSILYLAKEREERNIFRVNLKTLEISEPFVQQLNDGGGHDISEMKFDNGYLYYLERGLGCISRINVNTGEKTSVSFHNLDFYNGQRIFKNDNPQFGMAEAFILTPDEIWIGFDNNGDPVSDYGKSLGLKEGNKTAIFLFKRPRGF